KLWNFANIVDGDITLVAEWDVNMSERFTVTFNPNNGKPETSVTVPKGTSTEAIDDPVRYGWSFAGWFTDTGVKWNFANSVNSNITLTAKWNENNDERYTVTFELNNGTMASWSLNVIIGDKVAKPADPSWYGWSFIGWFDGDSPWDFGSAVGGDMVLTAKWDENMEDRWTITFDPNNGQSAWYITVPKGNTIAEPGGQMRHGWNFFGWFDGSGTLWSFANSVNGDMTLTAKWVEDTKERWTITFEPNNGGPIWYATVPQGLAFAKPADPSLSGWKFLGWFDGDDEWDFTSAVNGDITLTARWIEAVPDGKEEDKEEEKDEEEDGTSVTAMSGPAVLLATLAFILLMIRRGNPQVVGTVTQNGRGLSGAEVAYTVNGRTGSATTDVFGIFVIPVSKGSKVEIVSVGGRGIDGTFSVTVQKKLTEVNIRV
ncbi:MAG: InlB B-repeat-containing protein, partial [Methanomassiliicoccaceae archaeon]|nr:InlB B-repeat-containing protein [Methanomassiliicoccaceae archaeon]